jgi:hypothetical protein
VFAFGTLLLAYSIIKISNRHRSETRILPLGTRIADELVSLEAAETAMGVNVPNIQQEIPWFCRGGRIDLGVHKLHTCSTGLFFNLALLWGNRADLVSRFLA